MAFCRGPTRWGIYYVIISRGRHVCSNYTSTDTAVDYSENLTRVETASENKVSRELDS